jgi:biotin-dependent carboxylase-like uncharacterized protein
VSGGGGPAEAGGVEIRDAGLLATVQDLGRPGWAHLGVPRSGALDRPALRLANRLVGNAGGAAGIEFTLTGGAVALYRAATVAVTGAPARITVDGRPAGHASALHVRAGAVLAIGAATAGARSYLAVGGGIAVPAVLGSRSTDTLSGLGPAPLRAGDALPVGVPDGRPGAVDFVPLRAPDAVVTLRLHRGPRDDWFTAGGWAALLGSAYTVTGVSNRVGARLAGPAVGRADAGRELPSEGLVLGAVQVTADGTPLVFLADHPTTGGYPVAGVVDPADLPLVAQARPGDTLIFRAARPLPGLETPSGG